jgi:hypothetical protein
MAVSVFINETGRESVISPPSMLTIMVLHYRMYRRFSHNFAAATALDLPLFDDRWEEGDHAPHGPVPKA